MAENYRYLIPMVLGVCIVSAIFLVTSPVYKTSTTHFLIQSAIADELDERLGKLPEGRTLLGELETIKTELNNTDKHVLASKSSITNRITKVDQNTQFLGSVIIGNLPDPVGQATKFIDLIGKIANAADSATAAADNVINTSKTLEELLGPNFSLNDHTKNGTIGYGKEVLIFDTEGLRMGTVILYVTDLTPDDGDLVSVDIDLSGNDYWTTVEQIKFASNSNVTAAFNFAGYQIRLVDNSEGNNDVNYNIGAFYIERH